MARTSSAPFARAERPTSLHTRLVHGDIYGAIAARGAARPRSSRRGTTTTVTCSAPSATSIARRARRRTADRDLGRGPGFLEAAGHAPGEAVTIRYGLDELPCGARRGDTDGRRDPRRRAAGGRGRQSDRAEGHATLVRAFARVHAEPPERRVRSSAAGRSRPSDAPWSASSSSTTRSSLPAHRDPRLARAGRHPRPYIPLGGVRNRPARSDARLAPDRRDEHQRRAGGRPDGETGLLVDAGDVDGIAGALDAARRSRACPRLGTPATSVRDVSSPSRAWSTTIDGLPRGATRRRRQAARSCPATSARWSRSNRIATRQATASAQRQPSGSNSRRVSRSPKRPTPRSTTTPAARAGGRRSHRADRSARGVAAAGAARAERCRAVRATSTSSVASATPQMPTVQASSTERAASAAAATMSVRAISCCARERPGTASEKIADARARRVRAGPSPAVLSLNPSPIQASISCPGRKSSGSASSRSPLSRREAREQEQPALAIDLREPSYRRAPGRAASSRRCRARGRAEELRRDRVERGGSAPSTIPTTTTSVEKTTVSARWTRKLLQLNDVSSGSGPRHVQRLSLRPGSSERSRASGRTSLSSVVASVSAPSRISPPPLGIRIATRAAYSAVETKFAKFWRSKRCWPRSRSSKRPSGKRARSRARRGRSRLLAGHTRFVGVPTSSGTSQAIASPDGSVCADHRVERSPTEASAFVSLGDRGRAPPPRSARSTGRRRSRAPSVQRDRPDEGRDAEALGSQLVQDDRRDDEPGDDRRAVDRVDPSALRRKNLTRRTGSQRRARCRSHRADPRRRFPVPRLHLRLERRRCEPARSDLVADGFTGRRRSGRPSNHEDEIVAEEPAVEAREPSAYEGQ